MNVYDFDKTIYNGDATVDFYFFCLKKHPEIIFYSFKQAFGVFMYAIGKYSTKKMKESFFGFLSCISNTENLVEKFWLKNSSKIKKWYLENKNNNDLVISASPEFLLRPVCNSLGIREPVATRMDINSGKIEGENCKGEEKVRRFYELYNGEEIDLFYSDSYSDGPLATISKKAFLVKKDKLLPW